MGGDKTWMGADPFAEDDDGVIEAGADEIVIPHIPPTTPPAERRSLVRELRSLVEQGGYEIDPEIVALAVMKEGRMVDSPSVKED